MKTRIGIIGAGISGVSLARMLSGEADVTLLESKPVIGGLISCDRVEDVLYHRVGGHVFNSKNKEVLNWFWKFFDLDKEFIKAKRLAKVYIDNNFIDYPIEDHIYQLSSFYANSIVKDLLNIAKSDSEASEQFANFEDFLLHRFGNTLYNLYFKPYNQKIWNTDLKEVPLGWLDGKLPMPTIEGILNANILRKVESQMVHATFYYPVYGGSQFIIDRLGNGLNVLNGYEIVSLKKKNSSIIVNDEYEFDKVVYTGDIRRLPVMLDSQLGIADYSNELSALKSNGTTNVLCSCDASNLSWLYIPESKFKAHRIIYTGGFSPTNNGQLIANSCTVEFSNYASIEEINAELGQLPGNLKVISYNFEPNSYVIQSQDTRQLVANVKQKLATSGVFLLGRFAEWEYNNMDKCIEAAMNLVPTLLA